MHYYEFENAIQRAVDQASTEARRDFALETLELLRPAADAASAREHSARERSLFLSISAGLHSQEPSILRSSLTALNDSMSEDEIRPSNSMAISSSFSAVLSTGWPIWKPAS